MSQFSKHQSLSKRLFTNALDIKGPRIDPCGAHFTMLTHSYQDTLTGITFREPDMYG